MELEQKKFLEEKYKKIKEKQPLIKELKNILLNIKPNSYLVPWFELDNDTLKRLINDGNVFDTTNKENYILTKIRQSKCHENSYLLYKDTMKKGEIVDIMFWYAYREEEEDWVEHSWLINECWDIIETTIERDFYYWYILNQEDINELQELYPFI